MALAKAKHLPNDPEFLKETYILHRKYLKVSNLMALGGNFTDLRQTKCFERYNIN